MAPNQRDLGTPLLAVAGLQVHCPRSPWNPMRPAIRIGRRMWSRSLGHMRARHLRCGEQAPSEANRQKTTSRGHHRHDGGGWPCIWPPASLLQLPGRLAPDGVPEQWHMANWNSSRIVLEACRNRQDGWRGSDSVDTLNASDLGGGVRRWASFTSSGIRLP